MKTFKEMINESFTLEFDNFKIWMKRVDGLGLVITYPKKRPDGTLNSDRSYVTATNKMGKEIGSFDKQHNTGIIKTSKRV